MAKKKTTTKKTKNKIKCTSFNCKDSGGFAYFLGFIGALVYFISTANSFWSGVLGILKSLIWPLFLVLELFKFIGA